MRAFLYRLLSEPLHESDEIALLPCLLVAFGYASAVFAGVLLLTIAISTEASQAAAPIQSSSCVSGLSDGLGFSVGANHCANSSAIGRPSFCRTS
jgi:hypothetical protein